MYIATDIPYGNSLKTWIKSSELLWLQHIVIVDTDCIHWIFEVLILTNESLVNKHPLFITHCYLTLSLT